MSIVLRHDANTLSVTDGDGPLTINSSLGIVVPNVAQSVVQASTPVSGMIYFDTTDSFLKYFNGSKWVRLGDTSEMQFKANKQNAVDIGGPGSAPGKYLSADASGNAIWVDPKDDGYLAFNRGTGNFQITNNILFTGQNKFSQAVDMQNNVIANVIVSADTDAVPKSYVDALIANKVSEIRQQYSTRMQELETRYQNTVNYVLNYDVPNPPPLPPPAVPNPVRSFAARYPANLGQHDSAGNLAGWIHQQAIAQNSGMIPAAGSTYLVIYGRQWNGAVSKAGVAVHKQSCLATFSWNGSGAILVADEKI